MIIGLTGKNGAGKGSVAQLLGQMGFVVFSLSDVLRDELRERGVPITRESLIRIGQELRIQYGPAVLADRLIDRLDHAADYCVDSFRHPQEVAAFRAIPGFQLWKVEADPLIRFQRCAKRAREGESVVLHDFLATEQQEFNSGDLTKQDVLQTLEQADREIPNNATLEELQDHVRKAIGASRAHKA